MGDFTDAKLTLPIDSSERKKYPLMRGLLRYFPAALAGVAHVSYIGNEKHNSGQDLHHSRGKSSDHGDCILRHLMDAQDILSAIERGDNNPELLKRASEELSCMAWRALAYSQELHEQLGAPMAPGARK